MFDTLTEFILPSQSSLETVKFKLKLMGRVRNVFEEKVGRS